MRYLEINEGRDAPLYHSTSVESAILIIQTNRIEARTIHADINDPSKNVTGVSLSRSFNMAQDWDDVTFKLDQTKLSRNYSIYPYNYFQNHSDKLYRTEAEEFLFGTILHFKRYLISINVSESFLQTLKHTPQANIILSHPKIVINKDLTRVSDNELVPA